MSFCKAELYLAHDLHWDGTRIDGKVDFSNVYKDPNEIVKDVLIDPANNLVIDHLFKAPRYDTHHYFFDTGDCFVFSFNQPIIGDSVQACFENFECETISENSFKATLVGESTDKLFGKFSKVISPSSGLVLQKIEMLS